MYLRKIHIENYRLLKNVDVVFDRDLTLFVGKNNTGKKSNNVKGLFEALGVERRPIQSIEQKKQWKKLGEELETARQGTIYQVLKVLEKSRLLGLPPQIAEKLVACERWTSGSGPAWREL